MMSVTSALWKADGHYRENLLLGKEGRAGQQYYKGFASAHVETPPFIFGNVDVSRSATHCQNGWRLAPHKESKAPPLQLSRYRSVSLIRRAMHTCPRAALRRQSCRAWRHRRGTQAARAAQPAHRPGLY